MGICPKTNSFAPLIWINGSPFRLRNPDGSYFDEEYPDSDLHETNTYNTVLNPAIGYQEKSEEGAYCTQSSGTLLPIGYLVGVYNHPCLASVVAQGNQSGRDSHHRVVVDTRHLLLAANH